MFGSNVVKGIVLLAQGKAAGIAEFGGSNDALYASMAPLIAFPLVETMLASLQGQPKMAIVMFLSQLCCVLAVSVTTQGFAAVAGRGEFWVRTATALNWSFWFVIPLILLADSCRAGLVYAGVPQNLAFEILIGALGVYLFWYNWFTVRAGLRLGVFASVGIVVFTNIVVGLLSIGPVLIDWLMAGS